MLNRTTLRMLALLALIVLSVGLIAGCGDDDDDAESTPTEQAATDEATTEDAAPPADTTATDEAPAAAATVVEIPTADSGLAFAVTEMTAPAGEITLRSVNGQAVPHNIVIDAPDPVEGEVVQDGGISEITVTLEAGTYEYYCSVPGHREAGMVGTLTVE